MQQSRRQPLDLCPLRAVGGEQAGRMPAQGSTRAGAERQQRVQGLARSRFRRYSRFTRKKSRCERRRNIENHVPDRDPAPRRPARGAENPERQVLDRKLAMVIGRGDPALAPRVVGFIDRAHPRSPNPQAPNLPIMGLSIAEGEVQSHGARPMLLLRLGL